ncbi:MAG: hypothetical protein PVSMB8_12380 [Vulcanimicrobiaceae bacterium]
MSRAVLPDWRLPLRAWQREAFDAWNAGRPSDALVVATPGAGKTRFATRLAHAALADASVTRVIVVVPREHLKAQVARAMAGALVQLDHRFRNLDRILASDLHGAVVTYQQVAASPKLFATLAHVPTLVILDEIHHAGDQASWGQALRDAFGRAKHRVALSGTPFRSDGAAIPFVEYAAGECVASTSYDYARALGDGVCRALVARASMQFAVDHKRVHATLNQRFGGPVATATLGGLEARRDCITRWLERRTYDGMR